MNEIIGTARQMLTIDAVVALIVFLAMLVDLGAGLYKAYLRGDARRSEALKRTGYKFCLYEGSILIAAGIDFLIHLAKIYIVFGWELAWGVPFVTILLGIFWCVVEFLSVREKADEKTHSKIKQTEQLVGHLLKVIEALRKGDIDADEVENLLNKEQEKKNPEPLDMKDM